MFSLFNAIKPTACSLLQFYLDFFIFRWDKISQKRVVRDFLQIIVYVLHDCTDVIGRIFVAGTLEKVNTVIIYRRPVISLQMIYILIAGTLI